MDAKDFSLWLWGWIEIQNPSKIDQEQLQEIKNHLKLALETEKLKNTTAITVDEDNKKVTYCQPSTPDNGAKWSFWQTTTNPSPGEILIC